MGCNKITITYIIFAIIYGPNFRYTFRALNKNSFDQLVSLQFRTKPNASCERNKI